MTKTDEAYIRRIDIADFKAWGLFDTTGTVTVVWPHMLTGEDLRARVAYHSDAYGGTVSLSFNRNLPDNDADIETTTCHFGGYRRWFICPMQISSKCSYRVRILYFEDEWMGCRECCKLTYRSRLLNRRNPYVACMLAMERADDAQMVIGSLRTKRYRGMPTKKYTAARHKYSKAVNIVKEADIL
jgi:hypothetical protein